MAERLGWGAAAVDAEAREIELAKRALSARQAANTVAAEALQVPDVDGHRSLNAWLRATTNQPGVQVSVARARFCNAFPAAGDALWAGRVGVAQIDLLARLAAHPRVGVLVDADLVAGFLEHAEHFPYPDLKQLVDRWLMLADQDGALRDVLDDVHRRTASIHDVDGTLHVHVAGGDALTTERVKRIFDRACEAEYQRDLAARRAQHGDDAERHPLPRTDWQRRYDAFVAIFDTANAHLDAPGKPVDVCVNVLIDQQTLHDAFAQADVMLPGGAVFAPDDLDAVADARREALLVELCDPQQMLERRCETAGGQAVHPALVARALLGGYVRAVLVNARREIVEVSSAKRLFTGVWAVAAHLARPTCEHPGCRLPGHLCDIDHRTAHSAGGPTAQPNSAIECTTHNRLKQTRRWRTVRATNHRLITVRPDGTLMLPACERPPPLHADAA